MSSWVEISEELEDLIEGVRGDTPADTWLALAIQERAWGPRFMPTPQGVVDGQIEHLWIAMIQLDNIECILLWRTVVPLGIAMMPVIAYNDAHRKTWEDLFAMELNWMDGPPIAWKHFGGGEFVEWLRAPAVEEAT